jgi:hypothetical protein
VKKADINLAIDALLVEVDRRIAKIEKKRVKLGINPDWPFPLANVPSTSFLKEAEEKLEQVRRLIMMDNTAGAIALNGALWPAAVDLKTKKVVG